MYLEQRARTLYDHGSARGQGCPLRKADGPERKGGAGNAGYGKSVRAKTYDRFCAQVRKRYSRYAGFHQ